MSPNTKAVWSWLRNEQPECFKICSEHAIEMFTNQLPFSDASYNQFVRAGDFHNWFCQYLRQTQQVNAKVNGMEIYFAFILSAGMKYPDPTNDSHKLSYTIALTTFRFYPPQEEDVTTLSVMSHLATNSDRTFEP